MYIVTVISDSENIQETLIFLPPLCVSIQSLMMCLSGNNTQLIGNDILLHNKLKYFVVVCINRF